MHGTLFNAAQRNLMEDSMSKTERHVTLNGGESNLWRRYADAYAAAEDIVLASLDESHPMFKKLAREAEREAAEYMQIMARRREA